MTWRRELRSTSRRSMVVGGEGALQQLASRATSVAASGARLYVLSDENVSRAWGDKVSRLLAPALNADDFLTIPAGEDSKSTERLSECWEWLAEHKARRNDILVALGGGVIGDLAGFCAATYQRGMSLWQIPTSLLAQVDSSVGGKTAVNLRAGKNLVGAFYQPDVVVADPATLDTLPEEEFRGGLGEVIKYALLDGGTMFLELEESAAGIKGHDPLATGEIVRRCVEYKAGVVEGDEMDRGGRAVLNLGHTTAHALEKTLGYGAISHGQAVALGLLVATALSETTLGLDRSVRQRTKELLDTLGLRTTISLPPADDLLKAASRDKKVTSESSGFVCLGAIGAPVWGVNIESSDFVRALGVIAE